MRRIAKVFQRLLLIGLLPVVAGTDLVAQSTLDIKDRSQLFVDKVLVRETDRVWFTQHQGKKHPANPVLKPDRPWEGWLTYVYGDVIYDREERIFKMWYLAGNETDYFDHNTITCYATSQDGIHWDKPEIGTLESKNGKPHNAVGIFKLPSVHKDMDESDPARRYKMICFSWYADSTGSTKSPSYRTMVSPDGLNWTRESTEPIAPKSDVITGFWDTQRQIYVAFPKIGRLWRGHGRRLFSTITSEDFINWTEPVSSWETDLRDDAGSLARIEQVRPILDVPDDEKLMHTDFYGVGVYQAESCTIGFPWIFTVNNKNRFGTNQDGPQEVQLAVSRDLVHWQRPFRTPVIAIGEDLTEWDCSYHTTAAQAIRVGDEIWLYYGGANYTHGTPALNLPKQYDKSNGRGGRFGSAIGLVTWPLDRFVSVDASAEGGTLTTVPFEFSGDRLVINVATQSQGHVVVELCDAIGRRLPDYPPSRPFSGDDLRHTVSFDSTADVSALAGSPVSLKFHLKSASLYSFAFRKGQERKLSTDR
jgi:hypothetical protein